MNKKLQFFSLVSFILTFFVAVSVAFANTVTVNLENINDLAPPISGMQFYFLDNDEFGYPLETDRATFKSDFSVELGSAVGNHNGWELYPLLKIQDNKDYARGMSFFSKAMVASLAPGNGVFAVMSSENTAFAIDISTVELYDFQGDYGEIIPPDLYEVTELFDDNKNQTVTIAFAPAPVPVPGALWLLGSGVVGLISVRRRCKKI